MVWPNLNREPLRLVTPEEFTRLWSRLGIDFKLAKFEGPKGLALMGFYADKLGPSRRPLIYVNTAHHPAAIGAVFSHEMGHHLTAKIFASQEDHAAYLTYTAFGDHLSDAPELAADCLVSLGVFPKDTARKMFAVEGKPSARAKPVEPPAPAIISPRVVDEGLSLRQALTAMAVGAAGALTFSRLTHWRR